MKKRVAAGVLWFLSGWVAGAMVALAVGISPILAPIVAVAAASLVAVDPRRLIWMNQRRENPGRFAFPNAA